MGFVLEPIIIAAIAAGGTALLVLIISSSIFLYRRHKRRRHAQTRLIPGTASTSTSSSTRKGGRGSHTLNPYTSPIVPLVQPPPVHAHRRNNLKTRPQDPALYTPESTNTTLRTPDSTPSNSKLRKLERSPYTSPDRNRPLPPETPDIYSGSQSPSSNLGRMSTVSSIMLITYEQGLAKLGLSAPRPPPTAYTASPVSSASPGIIGLGDPSQTSCQSHSSTSQQSPPRIPAGRGNIARKPVPFEDIPYHHPSGNLRDEREEDRWRPLQPGSGAGWEERERRAPSGPMDAWLPSYYQPDDDEELQVPSMPVPAQSGDTGSRSRWGGRI